MRNPAIVPGCRCQPRRVGSSRFLRVPRESSVPVPPRLHIGRCCVKGDREMTDARSGVLEEIAQDDAAISRHIRAIRFRPSIRYAFSPRHFLSRSYYTRTRNACLVFLPQWIFLRPALYTFVNPWHSDSRGKIIFAISARGTGPKTRETNGKIGRRSHKLEAGLNPDPRFHGCRKATIDSNLEEQPEAKFAISSLRKIVYRS